MYIGLNGHAESDENSISSSDNRPTGSPSSSPAILAVQQDNGDNESVRSFISSTNVIDTGDMYRGWFPTLQKTLWILSKLYQCVNVCLVIQKSIQKNYLNKKKKLLT